MADDSNPIRRRNFLMGAGTAVAASLAPPVAAEAQTTPSSASAPPDAEPLLTLTQTEHAFFVAAADTLIPADDLSPRMRSPRNISKTPGRWFTPRQRRPSADGRRCCNQCILNVARWTATPLDRTAPLDGSDSSPRSASPYCRRDRR